MSGRGSASDLKMLFTGDLGQRLKPSLRPSESTYLARRSDERQLDRKLNEVIGVAEHPSMTVDAIIAALRGAQAGEMPDIYLS